MQTQKILIIQTAFIGDVVLATGLVEKLHQCFPQAVIDMLVRKGNEGLFSDHPFLNEVLIWEKKKNKYKNLLLLLHTIRAREYNKVINLQRFAATGFLTAFSKAKEIIGFDKNPLSFLFSKSVKHVITDIKNPVHEIERNHALISFFTDDMAAKPRLYPSKKDAAMVAQFQYSKYICIAPASVWFTKQFPAEKWVSFLDKVDNSMAVYLLGAPGDKTLCDLIAKATSHTNTRNLAGTLSFLQAACLQQSAVMNYVNDSAPMHFASAVNAPVTAIYCSTIPGFGYGPLSDESFIVQTTLPLACKPCGLHGHARCPEKHFKCALTITNAQLLQSLK